MQRIEIYGVIGWDVMADEVVRQIAAIADSADQDIRVHINSGGGLVTDALAIHNRLASHPGRVSIVIDALAASAATLVMLAGDDVTMPDNAELMIHMPWNSVSGNAEELREQADDLDQIGEKMVGMYAARTGMDHDEMRQMLLAETWLTAEQAKALGFVDYVTSPARKAESKALTADRYLGVAASSEDLPTYQHAPSWVLKFSRQSQAPQPRQAATLIDTKRGEQKEAKVADATTAQPAANEQQASTEDELLARLEALEAENAELRSALEANREQVDEVSTEKEVVEQTAAALERRVQELEDEAVRKDIRAAGVPVEHHEKLVALKRTDSSLFDVTVKALGRRGPTPQAEIGSTGGAKIGGGATPVVDILAAAEKAGVMAGTGKLSLWVSKNHPNQYEEVMAAAGC